MTSEPKDRLECRDVSFARPGAEGRLPVLDDLSFMVDRGEFVALIGPSGCGKSTLLSILAGLEEPDDGEVLVSGSPDRLGTLTLLPQSDALLPWKTVLENVATGPRITRADAAAAAERARATLAEFGLGGFERHYPHALSGGMRQRVALARAVLGGARYWLLDEPFGALDAFTRAHLQRFVAEAWERHRPSVVLVTHDLDEALSLADRVLVSSSRPGRIIAELAVELPRPRPPESTTSPEFTAYKRELMEHLFASGAFA
jgi:ABC-type nitrate/sulfonate/bicarbonate transport system ATPase subunit